MAVRFTPIEKPTNGVRFTPLVDDTDYEPIDVELPTGGFFPELGKGIVRGALNVGATTVGTLKAATKLQRMSPLWDVLYSGVESITGRTFEEEQKEAKKRIKLAQEKFPMTHKGGSAWAGRVIGEAIPYMGAALAGGYMVGPVGAAMVGFSVEGDMAYDNAIAKGASEKEAQIERVVIGSINAYIESLQIKKLMKFHKTGKHSIKNFVRLVRSKSLKLAGKDAIGFSGDVLKIATAEAAEELAQEGVSISVPAIFRGDYPKKPDGNIDLIAIGERLIEATLGGFVAGGVLGGAGAMMAATPGIAAPTKVELENTVKRVQESNLSEDEKKAVLRDIETISEEGIEEVEVPAVEPDELANKLRSAIEEVETFRPAEAAAISKERGKRFASFEDVLQNEPNPILASRIARRALAGTLKMEIGSINITDQEVASMFDRVRQSTLLSGRKLNVFEGLEKLAFRHEIPARNEIEAMGDVFGKDVVTALMEKRKAAGKAGWDKIVAGINLPRAIIASYDLSAPGRQGLLLLPIAPKQWIKAVGQGYRAFASPDYADYTDLQIKTDPYYKSAMKSGLDITKIGGMWSTEEVFISDFSHKIPGIPASERAYVTTLNSLRFHTFKQFAQQWEGSGKSSQDYKSLAGFINHATGRGDVKALKKYYPILNAAFFAPRLQMGRIQAITDLFKTTSSVRKLVAADLLSFVGGGILILTLLNMLKGVDVEPDPRSTDFGKIRIGNTRIDFWAGYQPIARYTTQFLLGKAKTTETKRIVDIDRGEIIWRFIQSKLSPPAGMTVDLIRGETFRGKQLDLTPEGITEQSFERFTPLFIQDVVDAIKFQGLDVATLVAPLALHGVGAMTYPVRASSESARLKDVYAQQAFGKKWDELSPEFQNALREYQPQIDLMDDKAKSERENFSFMERMAKEQRAAANKVMKALPNDVRKELLNLTVDVTGLSRHISSNWYLNDKRYRQYQMDTATMLSVVLPKFTRGPNWNRLDFETKREILKTIIDEVKEVARNNIIMNANIKDLEELE